MNTQKIKNKMQTQNGKTKTNSNAAMLPRTPFQEWAERSLPNDVRMVPIPRSYLLELARMKDRRAADKKLWDYIDTVVEAESDATGQ